MKKLSFKLQFPPSLLHTQNSSMVTILLSRYQQLDGPCISWTAMRMENMQYLYAFNKPTVI